MRDKDNITENDTPHHTSSPDVTHASRSRTTLESYVKSWGDSTDWRSVSGRIVRGSYVKLSITRTVLPLGHTANETQVARGSARVPR